MPRRHLSHSLTAEANGRGVVATGVKVSARSESDRPPLLLPHFTPRGLLTLAVSDWTGPTDPSHLSSVTGHLETGIAFHTLSPGGSSYRQARRAGDAGGTAAELSGPRWLRLRARWLAVPGITVPLVMAKTAAGSRACWVTPSARQLDSALSQGWSGQQRDFGTVLAASTGALQSHLEGSWSEGSLCPRGKEWPGLVAPALLLEERLVCLENPCWVFLLGCFINLRGWDLSNGVPGSPGSVILGSLFSYSCKRWHHLYWEASLWENQEKAIESFILF